MIWPYIVGGTVAYFTGACLMIKFRYKYGEYNSECDTVLDFYDILFRSDIKLRTPVFAMKVISFFFWIPLTFVALIALSCKYILSVINQLIDWIVPPPSSEKKKKEPKQITEVPADPYYTQAMKEVEQIAPN